MLFAKYLVNEVLNPGAAEVIGPGTMDRVFRSCEELRGGWKYVAVPRIKQRGGTGTCGTTVAQHTAINTD